jgi:hemerythrin
MGVNELDQDHKRLLRVAEMIAERVDNPETDPKQWPFLVREGLKYMEGYYESHIHREEAYMRQINYPHYESHKQVHEELERTVSAYINTQITDDSHDLDSVLELLGATYGWQMIHIAMDDMAIAGKGAMARPEVTELNSETLTQEVDAMLASVIHSDVKARIVDPQYKGENMNSAACQQILFNVGGEDLTLLIGSETTFLRNLSENLWHHKIDKKTLDKAHTILIQWCMTALTVGFWRSLIVRLTHDKPCVLKEVSPLSVKDTRQMMRAVDPKQSTLFETSQGRFFVACHY